ncbi:hypothetical protein ACFL26_00895 [Patescibacteria group bacterium]
MLRYKIAGKLAMMRGDHGATTQANCRGWRSLDDMRFRHLIALHDELPVGSRARREIRSHIESRRPTRLQWLEIYRDVERGSELSELALQGSLRQAHNFEGLEALAYYAWRTGRTEHEMRIVERMRVWAQDAVQWYRLGLRAKRLGEKKLLRLCLKRLVERASLLPDWLRIVELAPVESRLHAMAIERAAQLAETPADWLLIWKVVPIESEMAYRAKAEMDRLAPHVRPPDADPEEWEGVEWNED